MISLADLAWVSGSLALLVGYPDSFGLTGSWMFAGVAVVVAAFGVAQLTGLRATSQRLRLRRCVRFDSSIGVGRVRECASTRQQRWAEEVTRFDPEARALDVRFLADPFVGLAVVALLSASVGRAPYSSCPPQAQS